MDNNTFHYPHKPIANLKSLALSLDITLERLLFLQKNSDNFFFLQGRVKKEDGSFRETYDVKEELKKVHAKIVKNFFNVLKFPSYLHGGIKKRDYITNAKQHLQPKTIISEDIKNFFPSITKNLVYQIWSNFFRFSHEVAECLAEITTFKGSLVQGSKVSGYIGNLVLWQREPKLVEEFGKKGWIYTRFVDDITISSKRILSNKEKSEIISKVYGLLASINVKPNRKKHSIMKNGKDRQKVTQINVSTQRLTLSKKERNSIRSEVYFCEKFYKNYNKEEYKKLYNSIKGKVYNLRRFHQDEADKLLNKLNKIAP